MPNGYVTRAIAPGTPADDLRVLPVVQSPVNDRVRRKDHVDAAVVRSQNEPALFGFLDGAVQRNEARCCDVSPYGASGSRARPAGDAVGSGNAGIFTRAGTQRANDEESDSRWGETRHLSTIKVPGLAAESRTS